MSGLSGGLNSYYATSVFVRHRMLRRERRASVKTKPGPPASRPRPIRTENSHMPDRDARILRAEEVKRAERAASFVPTIRDRLLAHSDKHGAAATVDSAQ